MANDPNIRIPIEIPAGDMSGAEQAKKEIAEVKQAADAAEDPALLQQRIDDVAAARRKASDRRIEEHEKAIAAEKLEQQAAQDTARLRLAAGAALAASARQIAAMTVDVINQYKELGVELGEFESIGLEFANFLTSPFDYVADAFTGYKEDLKLLAESQRQVARAEAVYQDTLKRKKAETRAENEAYVNSSLARELQMINEVTAAYQRQKNEINALNKAREASIRAAEDLAVLEGKSTPESVAAARSGREQSAAQQEVQNSLADAERFYEEQDAKAQSAIAAYAAAAALNLDTVALGQKTDAALAARDKALLDLESQRVVAEAEMVKIASTALEGTVEATRKVQEDVAARAAEVVEAVQAGGRELSQEQKAARERILSALEDGRVGAQEQQGLTNDLRIVLSGFRGTTEEQRKVTQEFMEIVKLGNNNTAALATEQAQLRREVERLQIQIQERN